MLNPWEPWSRKRRVWELTRPLAWDPELRCGQKNASLVDTMAPTHSLIFSRIPSSCLLRSLPSPLSLSLSLALWYMSTSTSTSLNDPRNPTSQLSLFLSENQYLKIWDLLYMQSPLTIVLYLSVYGDPIFVVWKINIIMSQSKYDSAPSSTSTTVSCCSSVSAQLKLYQAFIFSVPIFFTFILLFFFYLFYLRRRRADWSSLRLRTARLSTIHNNNNNNNNNVSTCELGLKKEVREMLPIIVFKESFSVKDTQCSVCLGDYQAEDKLQQIPVCGHTFHMDCIDLWLATHTTCPLCRLSLLASRASDEPTENQANETDQSPESPDVENHDEGSPRSSSQPIVDPQLNQQAWSRKAEQSLMDLSDWWVKFGSGKSMKLAL